MNLMKLSNLLFVLVVVGLFLLAFWLAGSKDPSFPGTDGQATELITEIKASYQPWFSYIWVPPSSEIESLLFTLQAAIGAGVLGYCLGLLKGRSRRRQGEEADAPH